MNIFEFTEKNLTNQGLRIDRYDFERPWGGFFVLAESQAQAFADIYFDGIDVEPLRIGGNLSPKILLVKPEARLSWQYHTVVRRLGVLLRAPWVLFAVLLMKRASWSLLALARQ